MGDYKIRINIDIIDGNGISESHPIILESEMTEEEAISIDCVEKSVLKLNKEAIRKVIASHLETMSKKSPK